MRMTMLMCLVLLCAGCGGDDPVVASQSSLPTFSPPAAEPETIVVRKLEVTPKTIGAGQSATVTIEFDGGGQPGGVVLDWHGPQGWLVAFQPVDPSKGQVIVEAPVEEFEKPGRYRAVLRRGLRNLAETSVTVTSR